MVVGHASVSQLGSFPLIGDPSIRSKAIRNFRPRESEGQASRSTMSQIRLELFIHPTGRMIPIPPDGPSQRHISHASHPS